MKTIAVLAALAAVAAAIPATPGYGYDRYRPATHRLPAPFRREKKSPQALETEPIIALPREELEAIPDVSARTIGLKKPIIIKKKLGYHLYRDSDEEQAQADPEEKCTKEVKVKLCDAENLARTSDQMRSADSSSEITDNDMHQSIKLAKEAVENLQKMSQFKNAESGPDAEIHGDIEVARQALEHIQQNFGNLESMNVQATTLSDAEALQNAHFKIAHTDSERMAQWKEAIDNIHKNAEIARNINGHFTSEDSVSTKTMKSANAPAVAEETEHKSFMKNVEHEITHEMVSSASENKETMLAMDAPLKAKGVEDAKDFDVKLEDKSQQTTKLISGVESHATISKAKEATTNEASIKAEVYVPKLDLDLHVGNKETKAKSAVIMDHSEAHDHMLNHEHTLNHEHMLNHEHALNHEHTLNHEHMQGKSIDLDTSVHAPVSSVLMTSADHEVSLKAAEHTTSGLNKEKMIAPKTSENMESDFDMAPAQSAPVMKSVPLNSELEMPPWINHADKHMMEQKSAWKETHHNMLMKSNDNVALNNEKMITQVSSLEHGKSVDIDTTSLMKSADQGNLHKDHFEDHMQQKQIVHQTFKSADNKEIINEHAMSINHEHMNQMKSANLMAEQPIITSQPAKAIISSVQQTGAMDHEASAHKSMMKSADMSLHPVEQKPTNFEKLTLINRDSGDHMAQMKSSNLMTEHNEQRLSNAGLNKPEHEMRASHMDNMHENTGFQAQGKNWHADKTHMTSKSSDMLQGADFERNAPFHQQSHQFGSQAHASAHASGMMHSSGHNGHFGPMRNQFNQLHNHGFHDGHMFHGKAAEADSMVQASTQVNANDVAGKSAMEHSNMMQWKQKEAARGAYGAGGYGATGGLSGLGASGLGGVAIGAGAGSGSGAVGVFPNANVGGCAIPLLLSCSPSVVSGSLAKAGPSYAAHASAGAYRAGEEDFNNRFHNKRDIKKTNDIPATKVKRTPAKVIQKIPLEKKL